MHSLLSMAQTKSKARDQACYTPVFMGALSRLTVTCMHSFVLVILTHMHQICALFLSRRTSKGKDKHGAVSLTNQTVETGPLSLRHPSRALFGTNGNGFQYCLFCSPPPLCFSNFKVFSQVEERHCFPTPSFPWMRSVQLPWGRGAGGIWSRSGGGAGGSGTCNGWEI